MFKDITIEHFRGIRNLQLNNAGQINLFLGKNNCGKSTVLDAIFLLSGFSDPSFNIRINQMRGYDSLKSEDLLLNFYNMDSETPIHLFSTFDLQVSRDLQVSLIPSNEIQINISKSTQSDLTNLKEKTYSGLSFQFALGQEQYLTNLHINDYIDSSKDRNIESSVAGVIEITKPYTEQLNAIYMNSQVAFRNTVIRLANIINNKQEKNIVKILSKIEPKIQSIAIVDSIIKVDIGLDRLIPVNMLGDGIRRLMAIIVAMYDSKNGVILIDEVDNGLHYTAIPNLWIAILEAAKTMNIQVFATTHNKDALIALKEVLESVQYNDMQSKTVSFTLRRMPSDELKAYQYDFEKFDFAINQDIEMR